MAALQSIRSKGALLVGVLGLALFAFIAEEFFRSFETTSVNNRNVVGEVYGKKLSIQDFQQMVDEQADIAKLQMRMQGQDGNLNDEQTDQIREQVWNQFVQNQVVEHECDKVGLTVTDGEVQEALRQGTAQSLQMLAGIFGDQQTGRFSLAAMQQFLKEYPKILQQAQQQGAGDQVEQIQSIKKMCDFTQKQLRDELLATKYSMLFASGFISNPIAARENYDESAILRNAEVAALPYSTISDKDIKVTDDDLKAAYEQYKENFYSPTETRDIKLLDVNVVASASDRAALQQKVDGFQQQLQSGADPANVVRSSNSQVMYSNVPMSKQAFQRIPDVAANLDSMTVGSVKPTYYNAQDNTLNTLKLISKTELPDSILYRQIAATAATPEARKAQADSILNALNSGASFASLAQKYGQPSDSMWITSAQYESFGLPDESAKYLNTLFSINPGTAQVLNTDQGSAVIQVLDRRKMVTKYNVAVVKLPLDFSKKTYDNELSRLNKFLASNKTLDAIEKNAPKNGYMLTDLPGYSPLQNLIASRIGGNGAKECARWIFDEAKAGDVSQLYECGRNNDHLIVACVTATNDKGYLPWDNAEVKKFLTEVVKQNKKAEKALALAKGVKTTADMQKLKGAVMATLTNQAFAAYPAVDGVGVPEPKLAAAIAKTGVGKYSTIVKGAAALYIVKVTGQSAAPGKFDAAQAMQQVAQTIGQRAYSQVMNFLVTHDANIKDRRYEF